MLGMVSTNNVKNFDPILDLYPLQSHRLEVSLQLEMPKKSLGMYGRENNSPRLSKW